MDLGDLWTVLGWCVRPGANLSRDNIENCTYTGHVLETDLPCTELGKEMNGSDENSRHVRASGMSTVVSVETSMVSNMTPFLIWLW